MNVRELVSLYRRLDWLDFYGRSMRRLCDDVIPQVSYSQAGEDVIVDFLLQGVGVKPCYLELGTNHPKFGNNTYKFYRRGCRGVLVEADPSLVGRIRRTRSRDVVLNVGVGLGAEESRSFYILSNTGGSTFDEREANERALAGERIQAVVDVKMMSINSILGKYFESRPDFLSIDVEGLDLAVLKSLDFEQFPIPVICAETCKYSDSHIKEYDSSIEEFLATRGYFRYASTYINTIFVNSVWFQSPQPAGSLRRI